jgi:hypothetical protein
VLGRFSLAAVLFLTACGRTEPVGRREVVEATSITDGGIDAGFIVTDAGLINAGVCEGPQQLCPRGFHCESGLCVLNGDNSELQVTLQWQHTPRIADDLDLHLLEPLPLQGSCEIYYGTGGVFGCGNIGQLDLDANGACVDTGNGPGADTENIIYPPGVAAPRGHYILRVDYWAECSGAASVPFVVTVRKGNTLIVRNGIFHAGEADSGDANSGVTMLEFDMP